MLLKMRIAKRRGARAAYRYIRCLCTCTVDSLGTMGEQTGLYITSPGIELDLGLVLEASATEMKPPGAFTTVDLEPTRRRDKLLS